MAGRKQQAAIAVFLSLVYVALGTLPKVRFEYKLSFKGPHLVQSDRSIPFWEYGGDAIASDENIRLTPSLRNKKGWVWTKNMATMENWSVEIVFRVTGRGRIGADGLAVWFTEQKGSEGPVYGSNDYWKGLGVFFDSFDNDGQHNNPYIMAMVNDGTKAYDHASDGAQQQIGGCLRDFRNKPFPVRVKVEYYQKVLTVFFNNGLTNNKDEFELCLRNENVELPKNGYFGVSAATGGLADDQDVLAFLTHSLHLPGTQPAESVKLSEEERQKFEKEFDDYYAQLEKQKQDYQQQHPDKHQEGWEPDGQFENPMERDMKMIFDGQNLIHMTMKELNRKLDELLGRQELVLSKVSSMSGGQVQVPQGGTQQGGQPLMIDTIKRHEVDRVLNNQNDLIQQARDIRGALSDVQQKANILHSNMGQGGGGGGGTQGGGAINAQVQLVLHELQENLRTVKGDVSSMSSRQGGVACPQLPTLSCVTPVVFFVAIAAQLALLIGYMVYRSNKEAQAKKFY